MDLSALLKTKINAGVAALTEVESKDALRQFGVETPNGVIVGCDATEDELALATERLTSPLVLKALADEALHKSDIGAVQLGITDVAELRVALADMSARLQQEHVTPTGYLVEETAPGNAELIIGGQYDPRFGSILMVGLGGIFVEIFKDVAYRICPIKRDDASAMLDDLQSADILRGARGRRPLDREAIIDALMALGGPDGLFTAHGGDIVEFDINPLIVSDHAAVAVDARIVLAKESAAVTEQSRLSKPVQVFDALFRPRTIAVAGASATGTSPGNRFIRALQSYGFDGDIYPIHPSAETVEGLTAYPTFAATPNEIDYAYITVAASRVSGLLGAAAGNVRFAQIVSSGFSETSGDESLEQELLEIAAKQNMRLLGPNCMGTHSPRGKATFIGGVDAEPGSVGVVSQSGGIGMDILKRGQALGLRFSGLVTNGNSIDVAPHELLRHFLADTDTKVIGFYLEDIKQGREFLAALKANPLNKPVVLLTGGLTSAGRKAAGSHTGAMTSEAHVWQALARQTGTHLTTDLDTFLDALLIFQTLTPRSTTDTDRTAVLFGNGGGTSVLGSDHIARAGFTLVTVPESVRNNLTDAGVPEWVSLANPIDMPAVQLKENDGRTAGTIIFTVLEEVRPDFLIVHLNVSVILGYRDIPDLLQKLISQILEACRKSESETHLAMVLRSDGSQECDEARRTIRMTAAINGIPVFDEVNRAALALSILAEHETGPPLSLV